MKIILTFILALSLAFALVAAEVEIGVATTVGHSFNKKRNVNALITFFEGGQLDNSACYGRNGLPDYDAKSSDMIGAMAMKGLNMCFKCLKIRNPRNNKSVVVKVIDQCEGCKRNQVDLTSSAFSKLANRDLGIVKITWEIVNCPSGGRFPTFELKKGKKKSGK